MPSYIGYVVLYTYSKDDVCLYRRGPEETIFEGGVFTARLSFPTDYPLSPPKMRFTDNIYHPNSLF